MSGVEILAFEEVACAWEPWSWPGFWSGVGVAFIIAFIAGVIFGINEGDIVAFVAMFFSVFIIVVLIAGTLLGANTGKPIKYETHYKVTIDESVSMTEFNEKYEVIEQEGKIYTVREIK